MFGSNEKRVVWSAAFVVYAPLLAALLIVITVVTIGDLAERDRTLDGARRQLGMMVFMLADVYEHELDSGAVAGPPSMKGHKALLWRAQVQYPGASIWIESGASIVGALPPTDGSTDYLVAHEGRPGFVVNAALPKSDILADWQWRCAAQWGIVFAMSFGLWVLARALVRSMLEVELSNRSTLMAQELLALVCRLRSSTHDSAAPSPLPREFFPCSGDRHPLSR